MHAYITITGTPEEVTGYLERRIDDQENGYDFSLEFIPHNIEEFRESMVLVRNRDMKKITLRIRMTTAYERRSTHVHEREAVCGVPRM